MASDIGQLEFVTKKGVRDGQKFFLKFSVKEGKKNDIKWEDFLNKKIICLCLY